MLIHETTKGFGPFIFEVNMKNLILVLLLLISGCSEVEAVEKKEYEQVLISGTIRQHHKDFKKWCWVIDSKHKALGVNYKLCGKVLHGNIVLPFGVDYDVVGSIVTSADNAFAREMLVTGASVGTSKIIIVGHNMYGSVDFSQQMPKYSNIWISGVMFKEKAR